MVFLWSSYGFPMVFWIMVDQTQWTLQHPQLWFTGAPGRFSRPSRPVACVDRSAANAAGSGKWAAASRRSSDHSPDEDKEEMFFGGFWYGNHMEIIWNTRISWVYIYIWKEWIWKSYGKSSIYIYIYWFIIIWRFPRSLGHRGYSPVIIQVMVKTLWPSEYWNPWWLRDPPL